MNWQEEREKQAEQDMEGEAALAYFYDHPEEWPFCSSCGKRKHPTGFVDTRVEFHCGHGGHAVTIMGP